MFLVIKDSPANKGNIRDMGSIPGSGRSPGGGHGNPLQYSRLENSVDRGTCGVVCRVANSDRPEATQHRCTQVLIENSEKYSKI